MNQSDIWHNYNIIFWDFDGVILDSMSVRDKGFERVLADFPEVQVERLMHYHHKNGGLSRYVKFRYFYEEILREPLTDERLDELTSAFSAIMLEELGNPELLIPDTLQFLKSAASGLTMHVVSGSDQQELRMLCERLNVAAYFKSIHGSPTPKKELVRELFRIHGYNKAHSVLIGDSINDLDAARDNGIDFIGYNNPHLRADADHYIETFQPLG